MRFADQPMFLLLVAVPLLTAGYLALYWRRRRALGQFGQGDVVRRILLGTAPAIRATKAVMIVVAVALAILALARPQYGGRTRLLRKRGIDIAIALDFSKSMNARDVYPSRLAVAKLELERLVRELGGDRVGLVAFAGETMEYPLTTDYQAATLFWRDLTPNDMPVGGTAIGRAIEAARRLLTADTEHPNRSKVVILLTDGEDHEGDPAEAARRAAEQGVRIYVLGIGSATSELIPVYADDGTFVEFMRDGSGNPVTTSLTRDNERQLEQIAEVGHGRYFRARPGEVGIENIRRELGRLRREDLRSRRVTFYEEVYDWFLLPAFLLLLIESVLPESGYRWRRRREAREMPVERPATVGAP